MSEKTMERDQMFIQMKQAALSRLTGRDPKEIAKHAAVEYEEASQTFHVPSLGMEVRVHYPDYSITPELPGWHSLVILHYLDLADGFPLTGKEIPFAQMKSGMVRGGGIDRKCELAIQKLGDFDEHTLAALCARLGGEPVYPMRMWRTGSRFCPGFR